MAVVVHEKFGEFKLLRLESTAALPLVPLDRSRGRRHARSSSGCRAPRRRHLARGRERAGRAGQGLRRAAQAPRGQLRGLGGPARGGQAVRAAGAGECFVTAETLTPVFAALGDDTRWAILARLGEAPASASALAREFPISRQAIVKHLELLSAAGLVESERVGRELVHRAPGRPAQRRGARARADRATAGTAGWRGSSGWPRRAERGQPTGAGSAPVAELLEQPELVAEPVAASVRRPRPGRPGRRAGFGEPGRAAAEVERVSGGTAALPLQAATGAERPLVSRSRSESGWSSLCPFGTEVAARSGTGGVARYPSSTRRHRRASFTRRRRARPRPRTGPGRRPGRRGRARAAAGRRGAP